MSTPFDPSHVDAAQADELGIPNPGDPGFVVPPPSDGPEDPRCPPDLPPQPHSVPPGL